MEAGTRVGKGGGKAEEAGGMRMDGGVVHVGALVGDNGSGEGEMSAGQD